jgi:hypothetical protein
LFLSVRVVAMRNDTTCWVIYDVTDEYSFHPCATHRHKTNLRVLQEMLPDDLLSYCQHHGLLDSILVGDNDDDGPSYASTSPEFMVSSVGGRLPSPQESG